MFRFWRQAAGSEARSLADWISCRGARDRPEPTRSESGLVRVIKGYLEREALRRRPARLGQCDLCPLRKAEFVEELRRLFA